jgi:hypothetical protein
MKNSVKSSSGNITERVTDPDLTLKDEKVFSWIDRLLRSTYG